MIGHYLFTAFANARRTPWTTAANILALSLGIACFLGAFGIAQFWRSADSYHPNAERTFWLAQGFQPKGAAKIAPQLGGSAAVAKHLASDFPEVERVARYQSVPKQAMTAGMNKALFEAAYVDPAFLEMFDLDFVAGDKAKALAAPGNVVLTQSAAERLFGKTLAIGQRVRIGNRIDATVTGVIGPIRQPSFMGNDPDLTSHFDFIGDLSLSPSYADFQGEDEWFSAQVVTFFQLRKSASVTALNARLPAFVDRQIPPDQRSLVGLSFQAFPLGEIATRSLDNQLFATSPLKLTTVGVLMGLGALILLVAVINYANLANAQASLTAKQIGLRKVLGAEPWQVMAQSWLTSLAQTILALILALALLAIVAPLVKANTGIDILFFLTQGPASLGLVALTLVLIALAAGVYPALTMAGVRPVRALQAGRSRTGPQGLARVLVGVQFGAASFLIVLLAVSYMQRAHLEKVSLAPRTDPIIVLNEVQSIGVDGPALVEVLRRLPGVKHAAVTERVPWTTSVSLLPLVRSPEAGAQEYSAFAKHVGHDYFDTLGFKVLGGRIFDREHETETLAIMTGDRIQPIPVVVDATYAKALGYDAPADAVGQTIYASESLMRMAGGSVARPLNIIGVIEPDTTWLGQSIAKGNVYFFGPTSPFGNGLRPVVRIAREDVRSTVAGITRTWEQFAPTTPIDLQFFDQMFKVQYRQYALVAGIFTVLTDIALVIAALGLLGMAVHVAARRRHEIAVRKTLGSTTFEAVQLLLADFAKPVIIANIVAWPLAYLAAKAYLSAFSEQMNLNPWPFLLSLAATLAVALVVVAGQTLTAARVSPAQALRDQ